MNMQRALPMNPFPFVADVSSRPLAVRAVAQTFACLLLTTLFALSSVIASGQPARPNVIVLLTDDQGYGDLGCLGNPVLKTPHLDKLHDESIRFTDFHVSPMCTPTRSQLLTGRDALANGATSVCSGRTFVRRELPMMAELFSAAGYRTGLFGKWHLGENYPHRPNDRGFQEAVYHLGWGITSTPDHWNNDYFDDVFRRNGRAEPFKGYCTDVFFEEAQRWMKSCATAGRPFLCYLALNAPHGPFYVAQRYKEPYKHLAPDVAGFFGMIANLDENMGRLEAMLRDSGLHENTILLFLGDNGGTGGISVFNAGMRGAKASLYEGGHRVPCFIRWPAGNLRAAGDVPSLTQVQDLLPTLVELCGVKVPRRTRFDGVSLVPLLRGQQQPLLTQRMLVVQFSPLVRSDPEEWDAAVLHRRWRLIKGTELYDLERDPGQQTNVAAEHPEQVKAMRAHYEKWWRAVRGGLTRFETIDVGSDAENPAVLTSMDWLAPILTPASQVFDVRLAGQTMVTEGSLPGGRPQPVLNGPWNLRITRAGVYTISLRRWPREADAPLSGSVPAYQGVDGSFPAGKALPIAKARLRVGTFDATLPVNATDKEAVFEMRLKPGRTQLQTWFYDAQDRELCGAFYVEVLRKP
jgi:arylsulfatase